MPEGLARPARAPVTIRSALMRCHPTRHEITMNKRSFLLPSLLVLTVAACGPAPSDQTAPVADTAATASPTTPQVEVAPTTMIHAEPASLSECRASVVTIKWDVRKEKPGLSTVKIYTANGKLFTHTGASGSQETGPWVKPGSTFVLKSGVDDTELERLTIGGPVCS